MSVLSEIVSLTDSSEERVWHVSWHPKGTHLAAAGEDKVVRIYASATGDWGEHDSIHCISTLEDAQTRTVRCCEWSPNGKMIACASFDGTVVVWETRDASLMHWDQVASLDGHENEVKSVAWSPVGFWVATCGRDKKVWIWEQEQGSEFECVSMLDGHTQDVKFVTWHPTEAILLSCGYDDTIKIWKEDEEEFFCCETLDDHEDTVWGMTIDKASGGRQMISSCADGCLKLWECDEAHGQGAWRCKHTLDKLHRFPVYSVHWGAHYIASGGGDDDITLLRVTKGEEPTLVEVENGRVKQAHAGDVNCVRFGPVVGGDQECGTAEREGGMEVETAFRVTKTGAPALPSHRVLASCGDDGAVRLWRVNV